MKDNISPEEKLLRLIRGQKKQGSFTEKISTISVQDAKTVKNRLLNFSFQKNLFFLNINKIIFAAFIISCLYLIYTFARPLFLSNNINLPKVTEEKIPEEKIQAVQQIKPYEYYLEGLKNRQIFSSASGQESEKSVGTINADLIKDMSLIGIIAGENPQAIIQDKKAQKTYYVAKGQFIGEFKVEDIQDGKIILNYKGQKFELYL